ncbi:MAG: hypothetical protein A4E73_02383 [Syntrophaceae bacterium PtaU1.Bin231]|nr:MAG: hypothetical protein A4E73_02383 [Syntrophaceae bacterium PtaU1.Bin231]
MPPGLERAGAAVPGYDDDGQIVSADFLPVPDRSLVHLAELVDAQVVYLVAGMDDRDDGVDRDDVFEGGDALGLGQIHFILLDLSRGHGQVGRLVDQGLDPFPRAASGKRNVHPRVRLHIGLQGRLHDGQNRRRSLDHDALRGRRGTGRKQKTPQDAQQHHFPVFLHGTLPFDGGRIFAGTAYRTIVTI